MLKKWMPIMATTLFIGLSGCASTQASDTETADNTSNKDGFSIINKNFSQK